MISKKTKKEKSKEIVETAKKRNWSLPEKVEYQYWYTEFKVVCDQGHLFTTNYQKFKKGGCLECHRNKQRQGLKKRVKKICKKQKVSFIKLKYNPTTTKYKIKIKCEKGHTLWVWLQHLETGKWECLKCNIVNKVQEIKSHVKNYKGKLLKKNTNNYRNPKFLIECTEGHIFKDTYSNIKQRKCLCPVCYGYREINTELVKEYVKNQGGTLLKDFEYCTAKSKFKIKCNQGHVWKTDWHIISRGCWCPCCYNKTEQLFRETVENYFNKRFIRVRPKWLQGLELDGYNKELKIAFEYQGQQHYKQSFYNDYSKSLLKRIKKRDLLKKKLCEKRGVLLIVIPYYIPKEKWITGIRNKYRKWTELRWTKTW